MDVEVEVVPLGPTPLQHAPMDASFTEDHDKKDEDNPPSNQAPHPTQASSFRLKHATDPSKFKPVEVPSDGGKIKLTSLITDSRYCVSVKTKSEECVPNLQEEP
eukprot:Gregarina_sp_Pseudo_9__983@NODE_1632_length_1438_cov_68_210150_g1512_i0_p4_GENE_NODE_1632_length_1438_cov_68_210150_g1512_i0NODE_1632_length_1438_cov_68_210150_g1512_i0_p4_ORF_typecomplete_len104_score7_49Interferbind/PF09294_10/0_013_NODE_1632_length_1438_cov_68_210150_g1512_i09741285